MENLSDKILVEQHLNDPHDATCFGELYRRYAHLIFGVAYKHLRNEEQAETIKNDTLLQLRKATAEIENLAAWLHRVAQNKCIDALRKQNLEVATLDLDDEIDLYDKNDVFFVPKNELERLIEEEGERYILTKIDDLPTEMRKCAVLRFVDGLKHKEIAAITALTEGDVRNNLQKARLILRKTIRLVQK